MFGVLRTTLALMVAGFHLFYEEVQLGTYAVFGFYIISGYLMTLIMHESYGYNQGGRRAFAINRFLRLYPLYWIAALFSITLIIVLGSEIVEKYRASMFLPVEYKDYLFNLLMIFPDWHPNTVNPRLVPPTWALTVELFFYVLICLGISKTLFRVRVWFALSLCYVAYSFMTGMSWGDRYVPVAAASLPFSIGAYIYFIRDSESFYKLFSKAGLSSSLLFLSMIANCFVWIFLSGKAIGDLVEIGAYLNIIICALLVYSLVRGGQIIKLKASVDKFIGDFSYPIYLLHWQSGLLVSYLFFGEGVHEFSLRGAISFALALALMVLLSFMLIRVVDKPIQSIRSSIKAKRIAV